MLLVGTSQTICHTFPTRSSHDVVGFTARALHVAAYSHLIETLGMPESTYNEFLEYEAMKEKHDYFMDLSNANGTTECGDEHRLRSVRSLKVCSCSVRLSCC